MLRQVKGIEMSWWGDFALACCILFSLFALTDILRYVRFRKKYPHSVDFIECDDATIAAIRLWCCSLFYCDDTDVLRFRDRRKYGEARWLITGQAARMMFALLPLWTGWLWADQGQGLGLALYIGLLGWAVIVVVSWMIDDYYHPVYSG